MTRAEYETYCKAMEAQTEVSLWSFDGQMALAHQEWAVSNGGWPEAQQTFTAAEIAAFLGIDLDEFFARAAAAGLQPVQANGELVYAFRDVIQFLRELGVIESPGEDTAE